MSEARRRFDAILRGRADDPEALGEIVRSALRGGDLGLVDAALEALVAVWQTTRTARLGAVIGRVAALDHPARVALREAALAARLDQTTWLEAAAAPSPSVRRTLAELLDTGSIEDALERVAAVAQWPPDPGVADALHGLLARAPWIGRSARAVYAAVFDVLRKLGDPRSIERLGNSNAPAQPLAAWWTEQCEASRRWIELGVRASGGEPDPDAYDTAVDALAALVTPREPQLEPAASRSRDTSAVTSSVSGIAASVEVGAPLAYGLDVPVVGSRREASGGIELGLRAPPGRSGAQGFAVRLAPRAPGARPRIVAVRSGLEGLGRATDHGAPTHFAFPRVDGLSAMDDRVVAWLDGRLYGARSADPGLSPLLPAHTAIRAAALHGERVTVAVGKRLVTESLADGGPAVERHLAAPVRAIWWAEAVDALVTLDETATLHVWPNAGGATARLAAHALPTREWGGASAMVVATDAEVIFGTAIGSVQRWRPGRPPESMERRWVGFDALSWSPNPDDPTDGHLRALNAHTGAIWSFATRGRVAEHRQWVALAGGFGARVAAAIDGDGQVWRIDSDNEITALPLRVAVPDAPLLVTPAGDVWVGSAARDGGGTLHRVSALEVVR